MCPLDYDQLFALHQIGHFPLSPCLLSIMSGLLLFETESYPFDTFDEALVVKLNLLNPDIIYLFNCKPYLFTNKSIYLFSYLFYCQQITGCVFIKLYLFADSSVANVLASKNHKPSVLSPYPTIDPNKMVFL